MSDAVIQVENLSKRYFLAHQGSSSGGFRYQRFSDVLINAAKAPFRALNKGPQPAGSREEFWALRDVSFEIKRGEVVGIVGRNGAGKSTLLKILSRITEPTSGRIGIDGRVASLLEVGTGFHPELTGRENIYLNGAILGMARREITRKFDEIVAFAEVEKFLDTPVRFYSSGMYVRLAFAVAAHLEPEILIVDEVLAVGDAQFQKKCLGKMQDVSTREGRTVLFVSHNMAAVQRLCQRCILLKNGMLGAYGPTNEICSLYFSEGSSQAESSLENLTQRSGSGEIRFTSLSLEDPLGNKITEVQSGSDFVFVLGFKCSVANLAKKVDVGISVHQPNETTLSVVYSSYTGERFESVPASGEFRCHVKKLPLGEGRYPLGARVLINDVEADWPSGMIGALEVIAGDFYGTGEKGFGGGAPLLLAAAWSLR